MSWTPTLPAAPSRPPVTGWFAFLTIVPPGIASAEAFGTTLVAPQQKVLPSGIASAEAFGTPALTYRQFVTPTGIASLEAFGGSALNPGTVQLLPSGIATREALGAPAVTPGGVLILTVGIAAGSVGTPTITPGPVSVAPSSIGSGEAFGSPSVVYVVAPAGIVSEEAFGPVALAYSIGAAGIASGEVFGTANVMGPPSVISPTGIASLEAFGGSALQPGTVTLLPSGIGSAQALGSPTLMVGAVNLAPAGIASGEAFGAASVALFLLPTGISSAESIGAATVLAKYTLAPSGIGSAEAIGSPTLSQTGPVLLLTDLFNRADAGNGTLDSGVNWDTSGTIDYVGFGGVTPDSWVIGSNMASSLDEILTSARPKIQVQPKYQAFEMIVGVADVSGPSAVNVAVLRLNPDDSTYVYAGLVFGGSFFVGNDDGSIDYGGSGVSVIPGAGDTLKYEVSEAAGVATYSVSINGVVQDSYADVTNYASSPAHDSVVWQKVDSATLGGQPTDSFKLYGNVSTYVRPKLIASSGVASAEAFGSPTLTKGIAPKPTIKGSAAYAAATGAIPTHAAGDLILIAAGRANTTQPTKPTAGGTVPTYADIDQGTGTNAMSIRTASFIATGSTTTTGTWTNTTWLNVIVIAAGTFNPSTPIGGHAKATNASAASSVSPSVTMSKTDGSSLLLDVHQAASAGFHTGTPLTPPAGTTRVVNAAAGTSCVNTKTTTTSDGTLSQAMASSMANAAATIEVLALP